MANAQAGKFYAVIQGGRCHKVFTITDLPEWNEADIQVVDVTSAVPNEGDVYLGGSSFTPYVPPPPTQAQINAAADAAIRKLSLDALPDVIDILTKMATGADKTLLKAVDDKIKAEKEKKA